MAGVEKSTFMFILEQKPPILVDSSCGSHAVNVPCPYTRAYRLRLAPHHQYQPFRTQTDMIAGR
eukprot:1696534-Amphidinium_carterae.1